jgi:hypothetical protein
MRAAVYAQSLRSLRAMQACSAFDGTLLPVILAVDPGGPGERHEPRISAMLWSGHTDPRLISSDTFRTVEQFRQWLVVQRDAWLGAPIAVQWTPRLAANKDLVTAITAVLVGQAPPPDAGPPGADAPAHRAANGTDR